MEVSMNTQRRNPSEVGPDRFIKGFIANLVLSGHSSIPPRDPLVRRGLKRVVEMLDERARALLAANATMSNVRPWIDTGNQLRLSPTGGVENWERALRSEQMNFTKVGNPDYELVSFEIDPARAQSELDRLEPDFRTFVEQATMAFMERAELGE
jgi:hypothetical protein